MFSKLKMTIDFDRWYWSYAYGSKLICIKYIKQSDLPLEEKEKRIKYHMGNLGVTKISSSNFVGIFMSNSWGVIHAPFRGGTPPWSEGWRVVS